MIFSVMFVDQKSIIFSSVNTNGNEKIELFQVISLNIFSIFFPSRLNLFILSSSRLKRDLLLLTIHHLLRHWLQNLPHLCLKLKNDHMQLLNFGTLFGFVRHLNQFVKDQMHLYQTLSSSRFHLNAGHQNEIPYQPFIFPEFKPKPNH